MSDWEDDDNTGGGNQAIVDDDTNFEVDQRHVGTVIGQRGSNIREIEEKCNVRIKVGKFPSGKQELYAPTRKCVL